MTIDQFWRSQPWEIAMYARAYAARLKDQQQLAAWHVSYIINCWSKRRVTPKQLLGGKNSSGSQYESLEEYKKHVKV